MIKNAVMILYRPLSPIHLSHFLSISAVAKECGYQSIAIVPEESVLPQGAADAVFRCKSLDDVDEIRKMTREICRHSRVVRIFPIFERDVHVAACCRMDNGIPGLQPENSILFRDKNAMHERAAGLGIKTPRSCTFRSLKSLKSFADSVGFPIIIKPYNGLACEDTHKVSSRGELADIWLKMSPSPDKYRAEEFIRGPQFHVDSIIQNGRIVFEMLSQYTYSVLDFRNVPGGTITRQHGLSVPEKEILLANAKLLKGFGLKTGVAHVEFFLAGGRKACLGEAAARMGGGSIAPSFKAGLGINLAEAWARVELDPSFQMPVVRCSGEVGTEYLTTCKRGKITSITDEKDMLRTGKVIDAQIWKKVGSEIAEPTRSNEVLGYYVCRGKNFKDVRNSFGDIRNCFRVETNGYLI